MLQQHAAPPPLPSAPSTNCLALLDRRSVPQHSSSPWSSFSCRRQTASCWLSEASERARAAKRHESHNPSHLSHSLRALQPQQQQWQPKAKQQPYAPAHPLLPVNLQRLQLRCRHATDSRGGTRPQEQMLSSNARGALYQCNRDPGTHKGVPGPSFPPSLRSAVCLDGQVINARPRTPVTPREESGVSYGV